MRTFNDEPDAGVFLNGAALMMHGAVPSRDFVEPQGPGSFLWLALSFKLFGTTLETARTLLDATGVGIALLTFYLSRKLGATGILAAVFGLTISVPLLRINSPHYDSNLLALGALAVFLAAWSRWLEGKTPSMWWLAGAAVLCGVTSWTIQQKGVYLMAAMLASVIALRRAQAWRPAGILAGVYGAMVLLPFGYFAAKGALPDVLFANYIWPMRMYSELNACAYGFPVWQNSRTVLAAQDANPVVGWGLTLAIAAPFLLIAVLPLLLPMTAALGGKRWFGMPVLPYWLGAYALWIAELQRLDIGHLRNGVVVMVVLFFSICEASGKRMLKWAGVASAVCVMLAGSTQFAASWQAKGQVQTRRGTVYLNHEEPLIGFLETHTQPGEDVLIYPYQPIYYFVADVRNPTRYSYLQYHFDTREQFQEAVGDLEKKKVRYVIYDRLFSGERFRSVFPAYRQPEKDQLIMEPYLAAHYRDAGDVGHFRILERVP